MIRLEDVTKVYQTTDGPVRALSGISLKIEKGEFVAVRGPSGCGKSTLLTVVGGLGMPTTGRVTVAGDDLSGMSAAARVPSACPKPGALTSSSTDGARLIEDALDLAHESVGDPGG